MGLSKLRSICKHVCDTSEVPFSMTHLLSRMVDGPRSCDNIGRMRDPHTSVSVQLPLTILKAPYISKSPQGCSRPSDPAIGSRLNANPEGAYRVIPSCHYAAHASHTALEYHANMAPRPLAQPSNATPWLWTTCQGTGAWLRKAMINLQA